MGGGYKVTTTAIDIELALFECFMSDDEPHANALHINQLKDQIEWARTVQRVREVTHANET